MGFRKPVRRISAYKRNVSYSRKRTVWDVNKPAQYRQQLYFISAVGCDVVKIGVLTRPKQRLNDIQVANFIELYLLLVILNPPIEVERILHKCFEHLNIRGEWFRYEFEIRELVRILERLKQEDGRKCFSYLNEMRYPS